MGDGQRPPSIQCYQTLNLNVAIPNPVKANIVPSSQTLDSTIQGMNEGAVQKGENLACLAILPAYGPSIRERFQTLSHITPNQLKKDMKTIDQMKKYLYYFLHPAICHNCVHLARQENVLLHQGQLISAQQNFLQTLYSDLSSNFGLVNQQIAGLVRNQMSSTQFIVATEPMRVQYLNWGRQQSNRKDKNE
ncbi:hypothetical protein DSO57_1006858 [Entomophthora muscae]|uniref:Uncharacterized protein n=1 Tax=Entomophthora muscae TaxID=34485 RepID=A0ACC2SK77_9FUNG|nr:hypothetical protein DSO57_1006858 [Entomophthora muscae]